MISKNKVTGRSVPMPFGIMIGILTGVMITASLSVILTWCVLTEKVNVQLTGYGTMIILLFSTVGGSLLAITKIKRRKMLVSLLTAGGYFIFLLVVNTVFFGGHYEGTLLSGVIILTGACFVGISGVKNRNAGRRRIKLKNR